ncbi:MAG: hypothetical protein A2Y23_08505 [Clostridiales bacterium GWB2_37_7]|nr:MAG: hypothetical protein A2Y23_08505 [Clostridiales bacterium GWB2_37_7]
MNVKIDIVKIFFFPPSNMFERITLFLLLLITFVMFFGPLKFSRIPPMEAVLTAALPAISISWGWIVLLRSIFRKKDFCKD